MVLPGSTQHFEKVELPPDPEILKEDLYPAPIGPTGRIPLYNLAPPENPSIPIEDIPAAIIDAEDFARLRKFHWTGLRKGKLIRAYTHTSENQSLQMSRVVMGITDSALKVHFLNHNSLDNRKSNLAVVPRRKKLA
jgi:hypothetical protein